MSKYVNFVSLNSYFKVHQKEFYYSVLKKTQDQLQKYTIKSRGFYFKKKI